MSVPEAIVAAVGPLVGNRIAALVADQGTALPRATYHKIAGVDELAMRDAPESRRMRYQVNLWADTWQEAYSLSEQARAALRASADLTIGEILDNPSDFEDDTKIFRESFDIAVWL